MVNYEVLLASTSSTSMFSSHKIVSVHRLVCKYCHEMGPVQVTFCFAKTGTGYQNKVCPLPGFHRNKITHVPLLSTSHCEAHPKKEGVSSSTARKWVRNESGMWPGPLFHLCLELFSWPIKAGNEPFNKLHCQTFTPRAFSWRKGGRNNSCDSCQRR